MADESLADGAPSDVLVTDGVAANLHTHLAAQGRNIGGPQDVALLLHRAVERAWGTNDAPRFNDEAGGGWTIDLSGWLDGEMLYAQIRTVHGRRTLTTVVETEEYEAFVKGGKWQSPAAINPDGALADDAVLREAEAIEQKRALPAPGRPGAPVPSKVAVPVVVDNPDDPVLVVCMGKEAEPFRRIIRCTRVDVPNRVRELLASDEVSENDIEIWSKVTKPKVTIQF